MSRPRLIALLLALGALVLYLPLTRHQFVNYDDPAYVTENDMIRAGLTWAGLKWAFTAWVVGNWHPVTMLSLMLDCQLFGANSGVMHYENALFHAANAVLLFTLLLRLTGRTAANAGPARPRPSDALWPAAFAAALFASHPLHVESVAWLSERKDVLSAFFGLLTLLAYAGYARRRLDAEERNPDAPRAAWSKDYFPALLFFTLGLMSKPMLVTLPFVLLLLDFWPLQRIKELRFSTTNLRLLLEKWPFFLLTAAFCVVTLWSQNGTGAVQSESNFPFAARIEDAVISYAEYLWQTVWPLNLAVFYPANGTEFQLLPKAVAMAVGLAVVSWAVWQARRAHPYLLVGWLWFLGTLVPVIGLVKVGAAVRADRYTYIPLIGIFVATAFGARAFIRRVRLKAPWPAVVACGVLGACCVLTERQLGYWQDSVTLFSHALAVTRENDIAHSNLGVALDKRGLRKEALVQYQAAARVAPTSSNAHNNLGNWYYESGDTKRAMAEYREALRLSPGSADARINLGNADASLGRYNEALTNYIDARRLNPRDPTTPYLVGRTLLQEGRSMDAMPFFRQSLRMDPNNPRVLAFLAQVLASDEDPKVRDGYAAYLMAQKASHLAGGSNPVMLDALGMAYAELGRFADAQSAARDALRLARRFDTNDVAILSSHLKLYENHQAVRQSFAGKPASQPGGIIRPGAD